ncbi:MAG: beta-ketoacyl-ACP synthase [Archangium sp.]|nr:beta-ketoacyl-ACP synthase [Archangium sp.]
MNFFLNQLGLTCALGTGKDEVRSALFAPKPPGATALGGETSNGVATTDFFAPDRPLALGRINAQLPSLEHHPVQLRSRNNALLLLALFQIRTAVEAAINEYGPSRIGVILGTSTSGIGEGELAIDAYVKTATVPSAYHYAQQELGSPAIFLARELKLSGPTTVISTACSSSAKAMASAARWLNAGLIDAAIVGGGDSLCRFTIAGFSCLDSVSTERCNPMSKNRKGINIGEAAALFLMTRESAAVRVAGWGETSDAHHMSAPEPSGRGAADAMSQALTRAQLKPSEVGYVNLHGTATPHNDAMESKAVDTVLGREVPVSSTKPLTGHTLGAAGALEAALSWLTLTDELHRLPPHWFDGERDPELPPIPLVAAGQVSNVRAILSNSFAFGGSNASLALVRE